MSPGLWGEPQEKAQAGDHAYLERDFWDWTTKQAYTEVYIGDTNLRDNVTWCELIPEGLGVAGCPR